MDNLEVMHCLDGRWRVYRPRRRCLMCGHNPGLSDNIGPPDGFATEDEAEAFAKEKSSG